MSERDQEGFLERWARLKQRSRAALGGRLTGDGRVRADDEEVAAGQDRLAPSHGAAAPDADCDSDPAEPRRLTREDFADVDFEALDFNSDYGRFMQAGVPDDVRNEALRKLWVSDPVLANLDGLDDYCDDYTDAAVVPKGLLKTAYKFGRGFLSDKEVAEWEALGRPEVPDGEEAIAAREGPQPDAASTSVAAEGADAPAEQATSATVADADRGKPAPASAAADLANDASGETGQPGQPIETDGSKHA